ncbi:MAG: class A beta-lactamase-related serine hydrolase [Defluviitaleaceae bacterium]|nr:class A beta-lactamase-related serine hydrolase [Defluviitaleaceae bacterium]MCL2836860.1 class A beta-lactamase-related serine hydrolase [Defluviitaleaceae bacterium]
MNRLEFEAAARALYENAGGTTGISMLELRTGEGFAHNADWVLDHPASTIKLGILCAALYKAQEGFISLDDVLICKNGDKVPGAGVLQHLTDGAALPLRDMLMLMIIQSDNSATNIAMEYVGIEYINGFFDMCGLTDIRLRRKLFDYEGIKKGICNHISAKDLVRLLYDLEKRAYLNGEFAAIGLDILLKQQITRTIQKYICDYWDDEGNWFHYPVKVGSKSGRGDAVEHDCGIIYTPESVIVLSVLTRGICAPAAVEMIGRLAELAVRYFDPGCLKKIY